MCVFLCVCVTMLVVCSVCRCCEVFVIDCLLVRVSILMFWGVWVSRLSSLSCIGLVKVLFISVIVSNSVFLCC